VVGRAIALFGGALVLFSMSRVFTLSMVILALAGFAMVSALAGTNTLLQSLTSDAMRGRVMSLHGIMFMGMAPFGSMMAGAGAQRFGAPPVVAAGGVACMVAAGFFLRSMPSGGRGKLPVPGEVNPEEL
jgi:hypothetical protein